MDWDSLKIAHATARHGSLNAAARTLGTTQPTVSWRLDSLERRIGEKEIKKSIGSDSVDLSLPAIALRPAITPTDLWRHRPL